MCFYKKKVWFANVLAFKSSSEKNDVDSVLTNTRILYSLYSFIRCILVFVDQILFLLMIQQNSRETIINDNDVIQSVEETLRFCKQTIKETDDEVVKVQWNIQSNIAAEKFKKL